MGRHVHRYRTVIQWSDEDGAFVASIPALPGCMADGPTRDAALEALDEVVELSIAKARSMGWRVPEPERELALP